MTTTKLMPSTTATPLSKATSIISTLTSVNHHGHNKRPTIIVYPTVSPESVVIPIVSCIFGFPLLALLVICCLRHRAKLARERDRRRNYDINDHAVSLVRITKISNRLHNRPQRIISLRSERSMRSFPSLDLDTVVEEEKSDNEATQTDLLQTPESPNETDQLHIFNGS